MNIITRLLDGVADAVAAHTERVRSEYLGDQLTWYGRGYMAAVDDLRDQDDDQDDLDDDAEDEAEYRRDGI